MAEPISGASLGVSVLSKLAGVFGRRRRAARAMEVWIEPNPDHFSWELALDRPLGPKSEWPGPMPISADKIRDWLLQRNAVDFKITRLRLFIRGIASEPVRIKDVRCRFLEPRRVPIKTTWVKSPTAGSREMTRLLFDLDEDNPVAWEGQESLGIARLGTSPYFHNHIVEITRGERIGFLVHATVSDTYVRWVIDVDYEIQPGKTKTLTAHHPGGGWMRTTGCDPTEFSERWMTGVASAVEVFRPSEHGLDHA